MYYQHYFNIRPCSHVLTPKLGPLKFLHCAIAEPILPIEVPVTIDTMLKL